MIDHLKALWARVTVHWSVVAAAFVAALPAILDYLGIVDLKPLLLPFMSEAKANFIVGILPFLLAFLRPLVALAPKDDE